MRQPTGTRLEGFKFQSLSPSPTPGLLSLLWIGRESCGYFLALIVFRSKEEKVGYRDSSCQCLSALSRGIRNSPYFSWKYPYVAVKAFVVRPPLLKPCLTTNQLLSVASYFTIRSPSSPISKYSGTKSYLIGV